MAILKVQDVAGIQSSGPDLDIAITSSGGTLIAVGDWFTNTTPCTGLSAVTDSAGNEWNFATGDSQNPASAHDGSTGVFLGSFVAWCINAEPVTGVTLELGASGFIHADVSEWTGINGTDTGSAANGTTDTDVAPPAITLGSAGELVIGCCDSTDGVTGSPAAGTQLSTVAEFVYQIVGSAGSFTLDWTGTSAGNTYTAAQMAFTETSSSGMISADLLLVPAISVYARNDDALVHGSQLVSQLAGLATNVGPNALLQDEDYPAPGDAGPGPLTTAPLPDGFDFWRIDDGTSGQFTLPELWTSPTAVYEASDDPSNLGGIVGGDGARIDGFLIPAGTYVFQFLDLSAGTFFATLGGPSVLFRGCRWRSAAAAPGLVNCDPDYAPSSITFQYSDLGAPGSADADICEVTVDVQHSRNLRFYRNYISYIATGLQPAAYSGTCDVLENFIEKLTLFYGDAGPPGESGPLHLNGVAFGGSQTSGRVEGNRIVTAAVDEQGHDIGQTDCVAFFQDFGTFPGTGTNSDGSRGYSVRRNLVGGTGYCFYLGQNAGTDPDTVSNMHFTGNDVTTGSFPAGGSFGPATAIPEWGSFGNQESGNRWFDGPSEGHDIFGADLLLTLQPVTLVPGGRSPTDLLAGLAGLGSNTGVLFANTGREILIVQVGTPATDPLSEIGATIQGQAVPGVPGGTLPTETVSILGPFPRQYNGPDGAIEVDFSSTDEVSVTLIRLPGVV